MAGLSTSDIVQVIGWPVTFALGVAATLIAQRVGRKKKRISWSLVSESNFLSRNVLEEITTGFHVPIKVLVNDIEQTDLSTIRIKIANTGNIEVENFKLYFRFGNNSKVHVGRYIGELGAYRSALRLEKTGESASLNVQHINTKQQFEVEFLVGNYQSGDLSVDLSAPGIVLQRTNLVTLEAKIGFLRYVALGVLGIKYDPTASQTALLVDEVKRLRQAIEKRIQT